MEERYEKADIGVLFVHGIGQQRRGDTLLAWAGALFQWLHRWVHNGCRIDADSACAPQGPRIVRWILQEQPIPTAKVHLERAQLQRELHFTLGAPPNAEWSVRAQTADGAWTENRWLLAEAWWAEDLGPADFLEVIRWGIRIGPWLALAQFLTPLWRQAREVRCRPRNAWAWLRLVRDVLLYVPAGLLAGSLLQAYAFLLVLLAFIPIRAVRSAVSSMQRAISRVVGDSYLLVTNPIAYGVMVDQVQRDLAWLVKHSQRVAVVAHSQGAAIAHRALKEWRPQEVHRFITLGAGLRRLERMRIGVEYYGRHLWLANLSGSLALILVTYWVLALVGTISHRWPHPPLFFGLIFMLALAALVPAALVTMNPLPGEDDTCALSDLNDEFRWIDFYASADPVPNGPLTESPSARHGISQKVWNQSSLVYDHTTYWRNTDVFVPAVAREINSMAGWDLAQITEVDKEVLKQAQHNRRLRAHALVGARILCALSALALVLGLWRRLPALGGGLVNGVLGNHPGLLFLPKTDSLRVTLTHTGALRSAFAVGVIVLVVFVWYVIMFRVWESWNTRVMLATCSRSASISTRLLSGVFLALAVVLLLSTAWVAAAHDVRPLFDQVGAVSHAIENTL